MKYVEIDFEYHFAQEHHPDLVCCAWKDSEIQETRSLWLYHNNRNNKWLHNKLLEYRNQGFIFVSYAVTAEARCFNALGLDPTTCKWIDLYIEWRQLRNCYDRFNYGTYFVHNIKNRSVPPVYNRPHMNEGRDNTMLPFSLVGCVGRLLKINIDKDLKRGMRDLILSAPEAYTSEEQADILEYNKSDIQHLSQIRGIMTTELAKALRKPEIEIRELQFKRAEFSAHVGLMESTGIPLHMPSIENLRKNVDMAKDKVITDLVENNYPFFECKKKRKSDLLGKWTDKYSQFEKFIQSGSTTWGKQIEKNWKRTESGRYCTDEDYLKLYDSLPEIKAYRETRKLLNQLKWLRVPDEGKEDLFDSIGSDGRIRTFFGIFGSQTARNQPQARKFIFAMSAWLRCLIRPPRGYSITELDYAAQEFAIGAIRSKDPNMIEAYTSGDPYLYFATKAKAVSKDEAHWYKGMTTKNWAGDLNEVDRIKKIRNLFKSTTLGLQYGMGYRALAIKLSSDMGETVSEERAQDLIELHKVTYKKYWRWLDRIEREYTREGYLQLPCGWALLKDNPQSLSVRNFPVQGTGSSIIREAVSQAKALNLTVIATLHDSMYILTKEDAGEALINRGERVMVDAFNKMMDQDEVTIRIDRHTHKHDEPWISEKGAHFYELLKEYLEPQETREDREKKLMETVFS